MGVLYSTRKEEVESSSTARNEEKEAVVQRLKLQSKSFADESSKRHRSFLEKKNLTREERFKIDFSGYLWRPDKCAAQGPSNMRSSVPMNFYPCKGIEI